MDHVAVFDADVVARQAAATPAVPLGTAAEHQALIDKYCVQCHKEGHAKGELAQIKKIEDTVSESRLEQPILDHEVHRIQQQINYLVPKFENEHGIKLYPTPDSLSDSDSGGELVTDPKEFVWLKLSAKVL